jgi:hypothetical protein
VENPAVGDFATRLSEIHTEIKDKLFKAQDRQKNNVDKSRKAHLVINIGDKVWLLCRNLKTNHPCDKLDFRRQGCHTRHLEAFWQAYRRADGRPYPLHLI